MTLSLRDQLATLSPDALDEAVAVLSPEAVAALRARAWPAIARPEQLAPGGDWLVWFYRGGRGSGKTRAAAEWTREKTEQLAAAGVEHARIALIGRKLDDVRQTMCEGEALALDTLVAIPGGFVPIGDLSEGDVVIGGDGKPCTVTAAYPVLIDRPCYSLSISGATVVADAAHKWEAWTWASRSAKARYRERSAQTAQVVTTEQMAETLEVGKSRQANYSIETSIVEGETRALPIDPYVLGYWLGDGTSKSGEFTVHTDDRPYLEEAVRLAGYEPTVRAHKYTMGARGLRKPLRLAGLLRNKHIPPEYLDADVQQRLALVRGLIDSDGHVTKRGQIEFSNRNERLLDDVTALLSSLGIRVGRSGWRLQFTSGLPVASLPRKAARIKAACEGHRWRYVHAIEPVESVPVRCISVDSPDRTYLVTRNMVRTHNSGLARVLPPSLLVNGSWDDSFSRGVVELNLSNGAFLKGFSSWVPDALRGPQHHAAWVDEPASLRDAHLGTAEDTTWSNLLLGLRLPPSPQIVVSGTPRNTALVHEIRAEPFTVETTASTYDNLHNLARIFRSTVVARYEGTRLGRQELHGELLGDVGEMFQRGWFDLLDAVPDAPGIRWVRAWDLAATEESDANPDPDWTAGALVGFDPTWIPPDVSERRRRPGRYIVRHVARFRLNPGARDDRLLQIADEDRLPVQWIEQEPGSAGKSQISSIDRHLSGVAKVRGHRPTGAKETRAELVAGPAEQGRVAIVVGSWTVDLLDELEEFPNGKHDDQVDALSMAFDLLRGRGVVAQPVQRRQLASIPRVVSRQ